MKLNQERIETLESLIDELQLKINDLELFNQALVHSSYAHEQKGKNIEHNEKLEFLGDAILNLVISEYLYKKFPEATEGNLSKLRAGTVSEPILAKKGRSLDLGRFLLLGRGEEITGGRDRDSILANTMEAIIGAIYLGSGLLEVEKFIVLQMEDEISNTMNNSRDYKSMLQEYTQNKLKIVPVYRVVCEIGPEHQKVFEVELLIGDTIYSKGQGKSKKQAEQQAAQEALRKLEVKKTVKKKD